MFNAQMENKTSEVQMNLVQNRLRRLEFEEQRARHKIQKARWKAENLQRIQGEKMRQRSQKERYQQMQRRKVEQMKKQNTLERVKMKQHIQDLQDQKRDMNHRKRIQLKEEVRQARELSEQLRKEENDYIQTLKNKVKNEKSQRKTLRHRMKTISGIECKSQYQSKIGYLRNKANKNMNSIEEMERKEKELLDRLKITFKSVEEQENKVKSLERRGKKRPLKNAKSVVAQYVSSPMSAANGMEEIIFEKKKNKRKSSKFTPQESPTGSYQNNIGKPDQSHEMAETGQERS